MYDKAVAIAALAFIIVGDTAAALVGRKFGRHYFRHKTLEGSLGCLLATLLVALVAPGLPLWVALAGAVTATLTEAVSFRIDDNISVPVVSGLIMTLLLKLFPA
jgi:dolichol kinase